MWSVWTSASCRPIAPSWSMSEEGKKGTWVLQEHGEVKKFWDACYYFLYIPVCVCVHSQSNSQILGNDSICQSKWMVTAVSNHILRKCGLMTGRCSVSHSHVLTVEVKFLHSQHFIVVCAVLICSFMFPALCNSRWSRLPWWEFLTEITTRWHGYPFISRPLLHLGLFFFYYKFIKYLVGEQTAAKTLFAFERWKLETK